MTLWIILGVFAFAIGTFMSLQPSAKERALGKIRERARLMQLNPRVVACPEWLINASGEKGKGMVALYGLVLPDAKLPLIEAQVIDRQTNVVTADNSIRPFFHGKPCAVTGVLGLTLQANFIGLYWTEKLGDDGQKNPTQDIEAIDKKLKNIKEYLQNTAEKVQAKRDLA